MSTPPPTPPTRSKWGTRMGGVMRRASTVLAISRPGTPSEGTRDSDSVSLKRTPSRPELSSQPVTLSPPPAPVEPKLPTPIAESPAREAAAMDEPPVGPSRLAQEATWVAEEPVDKPPVAPDAKAAEGPSTSPTDYIPPPIIDSTIGNPGAFTDDPEALPQPVIIERDPFAPPPADVKPVAAEEHKEEAASAPEPAPAPVHEEEPVRHEEPIQAEVVPIEATHTYFDKPMAESMKDADSLFAPTEPDYGHGAAAEYYRGEPDMPIPEPAEPPVHEEVHEETQFEEEAHRSTEVPAPAEVAAEPREIVAPEVPETHAEASHVAAPSIPRVDTLPAYMSVDDGHAVWGGGASQETQPQPEIQPQEQPPAKVQEEIETAVIAMPVPENQGVDSISRASSFKMPNPHPLVDYDDPFADPVPAIQVTKIEETYQILPVPERQPQMPVPSHEDAPTAILMPLPPFKDVIHHSSMEHSPAHSNMANIANGNGHHAQDVLIDERMPLLSRPVTPGKRDHGYNSAMNTHLYAPSAGGGAHTPANHASISPIVATSSSWNAITNKHHHYNPGEQLKLHNLGWLEYHLPDGTIYYVHPTRKVTTDVNLRSEVSLDAVELWLDERKNRDGEEDVVLHIETWLREVKPVGKNKKVGVQVPTPAWKAGHGKAKRGVQTFYFEKFWVDHNERTVLRDESDKYPSYTHPIGHVHGKGKKQAGTIVHIQEDQLDLEYRYWSFMEAYPAHLTLPAKAKLEAMDVLTWAWTDRLLPSNRSIPSPFAQDECQELMNLLKSFEHGHRDDHGIQNRVVARILLRVAQWRQTYFRPSKPLPTDVSTHRGPIIPRRPFRRAFLDFFVSCLCLGIPYLFIERARHSGRITDEESGLLRGVSPLVVIGACTCLVAAIVLSASVTFLSLPGLDSVARTAGMVAVLFAAFTMVATGVSVLRHKADLERPVSHVGFEGLTVISGRSMALSLPIVFLAYSVIGFVVGIVLYTFRGSVGTDRSLPRHAFEDYMRWTVVGVVGALAGIVATSMILFRR